MGEREREREQLLGACVVSFEPFFSLVRWLCFCCTFFPSSSAWTVVHRHRYRFGCRCFHCQCQRILFNVFSSSSSSLVFVCLDEREREKKRKEKIRKKILHREKEGERRREGSV